MSGDDRLAKSRIYASLAAGINESSLSDEDRFRFDALSRLAIQAKEAPSWFFDACSEDLELLVTVHNILMEHENRYFRGNSKKGGGDEIAARVRVIDSPFGEQPPEADA